MSLSGPDGRVLGGGVAGLLTAASPVQVSCYLVINFFFLCCELPSSNLLIVAQSMMYFHAHLFPLVHFSIASLALSWNWKDL